MKTYLVGGAVRDLLMGFEPKDRDYVVVGATEQQMLDDGFVRVGASFPVFLKDGAEYALARTERKNGVGYKGFDVVFDPTVTLEDDLIRRDLTINSMAMDLETGEIIDPFGGRIDLARGLLRHTSEAFAEDPVRVLRTARFAARYGFEVVGDTMLLMEDVVPELDHVPQERVWAEFEKGLGEQYPAAMLRVLEGCGAMDTSSLMPYQLWSPALFTITDQDPVEVRFALLARGFVDGDYESCKIPTHLSRVSKSVNKHLAHMARYPLLSVTERLDILTDLRAFADASHMDIVLAVTRFYVDGFEYAVIKTTITADMKAIKAVDLTRAPQLAAAAGMSVKDYVTHLRAQAMSL